MRDILFRGIVKGDRGCESFEDEKIHAGEFIYGQLVFNEGETYIVGEFIEATDEYIAVEYWIPVIPETVGQFTGVYDRKRTRIFEGDSLKPAHTIPKGKYLVVWNDLESGFSVQYDFNIRGYDETNMLKLLSRSYEVIGNIHGNIQEEPTC